MIFASKKHNKKELRKYTELWDEIKNQINSGKPIKYKKDFTKNRFYSLDDLPLGKILSIPMLVIVVNFKNDSKYYPHVFIHEFGYKL